MRYEDVVSAVKQVIHDKGMKQCVVAERDKQIERMKPKEIFADAVSVGIISDPDAGICGQICVGGRENRYRDPVGGITGGRNPGIQLWSIG